MSVTAGLSAHIGVVLLATTTDCWFEYDSIRMAIGGTGLLTTVYSTLVAHTRADRKGAIAYATSATLGQIFVVLSMGYSDTALVLSLGHAAFRMQQILRSHSVIADTESMRAAIGGELPLWPSTPPTWLYRAAWRCRRIDEDFMETLRSVHRLGVPATTKTPLGLSRFGQWSVVGGSVVLAGFPFTPLSHTFEQTFMDLLPTHPGAAALLGLSHSVVSVGLIGFLFNRVLDTQTFQHTLTESVEAAPAPTERTPEEQRGLQEILLKQMENPLQNVETDGKQPSRKNSEDRNVNKGNAASAGRKHTLLKPSIHQPWPDDKW